MLIMGVLIGRLTVNFVPVHSFPPFSLLPINPSTLLKKKQFLHFDGIKKKTLLVFISFKLGGVII
jgi:hypothetical protein